jgi:hypothetical protein
MLEMNAQIHKSFLFMYLRATGVMCEGTERMWASLSFVLGAFFLFYVPLFVIGLRGDFVLLASLIYYMYVPNPSKWLRDARIWTYVRESHLNLSYEGNTEPLFDTENAYCFGVHPHGVHCIGAVAMATDSKLRHVHVACTSVLFWIPVLKEFMGWSDTIPVIWKRMLHSLETEKRSILVYPGAFNEVPGALFMKGRKEEEEGKERFYTYEHRTGFIRVAQEAGVPIVPMWVEGEYDLYNVYHTNYWLQAHMYRLVGYLGPFYSAGWYGTFWPKKKKLTVHVGTPIQTVTRKNVKRDIETLRKEFYAQLKMLKHKE